MIAMKVWVVYKCKRYEEVDAPYPCVLAVLTNMEKAKSFARTHGAWMTEVEIDKIDDAECKQ